MVIENSDHMEEDIFYKEVKAYFLNLVYKKRRKGFIKLKINYFQALLLAVYSELMLNLLNT
jgi:hypothetical protein